MTLESLASAFRNMGNRVLDDIKQPYTSSDLKAYILGSSRVYFLAADCIEACVEEQEEQP